mgnify:CR=1 FL=1
METNFEKSTIYKNALKEYQEKVYGEILKPLHIIVIDNDGSQRPANPTTRRRGYEVGEYDIYFINLP